MATIPTILIWARGDQVARDLIMQAHPEFEELRVYYGDPHYLKDILVDKNGTELPIDPEPALIADSNLLLLGGSNPNPYVKKYFVDTGRYTVDEAKQIAVGEGVYANGKRIIDTVTRSNGTKVLTVHGWNAIDTLYATEDYLRIGPGRELLSRFRGAQGAVRKAMTTP